MSILQRFTAHGNSTDRSHHPRESMNRILERMVEVFEGRRGGEQQFRQDMQRNPIWHRFHPSVAREFRQLYFALRSVGFDMCIDQNRDHRATEFDGPGAMIALRYGHREWRHAFSPRMVDEHQDAQGHLLESVVRGAQQLFMEVALNNGLDGRNEDRVTGGSALQFQASQRITFDDLDRNPPLTVEPTPRRDRPGFHAAFTGVPTRPVRTAPEPRVPFPTTEELRANAGADLAHLDVANEHLDDAPAAPFGPSEAALEQSYRV